MEAGDISVIQGTINRCLHNSLNFKIYSTNVDKVEVGVVVKNPIYNTLTFKGDIQELNVDSKYEIELRYEGKDPRFGHQYAAVRVSKNRPTTTEQTKSFLSEFISVDRAAALVSAYPSIVDMVLKDELIDTSKIKGIKDKTMKKIKEKIMDNIGIFEVHKHFSQYDISYAIIKKILHKYKSVDNAIYQINKNPYKAFTSINGVGFKRADEIALKMNPNFINSIERMTSSIEFILEENEKEGHTLIDINKLYAKCIDFTPECIDNFKISSRDRNFWISDDMNLVAIKSTREKELYIARKMLDINKNPKKWECKSFDSFSMVEDLTLTKQQQLTTKLLCDNGVVLLSGYAGVGKTLSTRATCDMMDSLNKSYLLCSLCAKATDVLTESTGRPSMTIHRTLGFDGKNFEFNEDNKINVDCIIVDEMSLNGINLFHSLLKAIDPKKTKLMLIFDEAQLVSIESGSIVRDLLKSNRFATNKLTEVFRQKEGGLLDVATKIRNGINFLKGLDTSKPIVMGEKRDFVFMEQNQETSLDMVEWIYSMFLKNNISIEDIAILSHKNIGNHGSIAVNKRIQHLLHNNNEIFTKVDEYSKFYLGDRVKICKNNYKAILYKEGVVADMDIEEDEDKDMSGLIGECYNGQVGKVIVCGKDYIVINIKDKNFVYRRTKFNELALGYALSITSSQGSGYSHCIVLVNRGDTFMSNKQSLYVGVTRAKKMCYMIGSSTTVVGALRKDVVSDRNTMLLNDLLREEGDFIG